MRRGALPRGEPFAKAIVFCFQGWLSIQNSAESKNENKTSFRRDSPCTSREYDVMRPRRCFSPLECSPGTSLPEIRVDQGARAPETAERIMSFACARSSASIIIAVNVSIPAGSTRSHPTASW